MLSGGAFQSSSRRRIGTQLARGGAMSQVSRAWEVNESEQSSLRWWNPQRQVLTASVSSSATRSPIQTLTVLHIYTPLSPRSGCVPPIDHPGGLLIDRTCCCKLARDEASVSRFPKYAVFKILDTSVSFLVLRSKSGVRPSRLEQGRGSASHARQVP